MLWLVYHNYKIVWRTEKVKMTRYPKECGKQWRTKGRKKEEKRKNNKDK